MLSLPALLLYPGLLLNTTLPKNYILFPDDKGVPNIVNLEVPQLTAEESAYISENIHSVTFWLYTFENRKGENLLNGDIESIKGSNWNPKRPTRFITHGWRGSRHVEACTVIRDAYLAAGYYNVIVIDWSELAKNLMYGTVAQSVPTVAEYVASFLNFLQQEAGLNTETTKLIGHSLGAHLVSLAAKNSQKSIKEVVVLDPAKPYFDSVGSDERVDSTHAQHVQVIHTNGGRLGLLEPYGTSDFYPNGGRKQPGCLVDIFGTCAHSRAYYYYAESISNPYGFLARSVEHSSSNYPLTLAYMGGAVLDPNAKGSYYLETASEPPFALT